MAEVKEIFTFFGSELWWVIQELVAICVVVAFISILITEAIKRSDKYVMKGIRFNSTFIWVTNIFLNVFLSIVFVFVFDGKDGLLNTILYCITVFIFSWSLSEVLYPCTDFLFKYISIVRLKLKKVEIDSTILVNKAKILSNEVNKELVISHIKKEIEKSE